MADRSEEQAEQLELLRTNQPKHRLTVYSRLSPAVPTRVYHTYWKFAAERQKVFFRKVFGEEQPWTNDPILRRYKFTNAYRASDRTSQFLIKNVIAESSPRASLEDLFFRIMLFKIFNKISTWKSVEQTLGDISWKTYSFKLYSHVYNELFQGPDSIYSAAYIMPSASSYGHRRKHLNHLKMIETMIRTELPDQIANAKKMSEVYELLIGYPSIGPFLAYQFATDINYSRLTSFSEQSFVVPGPGALNGIRKCFHDLGGLSEVDIIHFVADRQEEEFKSFGIDFQSLWGRQLQLIDCQNLFCEVDKYARVAHPEVAGLTGRKRIKQTYTPREEPFALWYPPEWGINELIPEEVRWDGPSIPSQDR